MGSIKLNINYNLISRYIILVLSILLFSFLLNTILYLYLPKDKPVVLKNNIEVLEYKRYELKNAFKVKK